MWKYAGLIILAMSGSAQASETLTCRTQISWDCNESCEMGAGPADIVLNFAEKSAEFCRGSRCNTEPLAVTDAKGQWDDSSYVVFEVDGTAFKLSGVVFPDGGFFQARSDELGDLAGTCEVDKAQ